jgi:hypothetical protein
MGSVSAGLDVGGGYLVLAELALCFYAWMESRTATNEATSITED